MKAVAREFIGRDIVPEFAGLDALGQQISNHSSETLLRLRDLLVSMQKRREFAVVLPVGLVREEGVRLEHGFQPRARAVSLVSDLG